MSETVATTTNGAAPSSRSGPRGPIARFTVDDVKDIIIRRMEGEDEASFNVGDLKDVWDDLAVECAIRYLQRGFSWEDITKGKPIPARAEGEKKARRPAAGKDLGDWDQAIANCRAEDLMALHSDMTMSEAQRQGRSYVEFLTSKQRAELKKEPRVAYAHAKRTGRLLSLDDVLAVKAEVAPSAPPPSPAPEQQASAAD